MSQEDSAFDEHRRLLISLEQKAQDDYDKTIVSLSGGALAISLVFIKDIVGKAEPALVWTVIVAWGFWAASIAIVVISYFSSRMAMRKAIDQLDRNDSGHIGGLASKVTQSLNVMSGLFFVVGIVTLP